MFGDYEDELKERIEELVQRYGLDYLLESLELSDTDVLVKLILDGHVDEKELLHLTR